MPAQIPLFSQSERLPLTINVRSVFFRKTGKATPGSSPRACFCELRLADADREKFCRTLRRRQLDTSLAAEMLDQ
jgi:hypothetical protein